MKFIKNKIIITIINYLIFLIKVKNKMNKKINPKHKFRKKVLFQIFLCSQQYKFIAT